MNKSIKSVSWTSSPLAVVFTARPTAAQRNARVVVVAFLLCGCGATDGQASDRRTPPSPQPEPIATTTSALVGGSPFPSVNVTQGLVPNSYFESETAAVTLDSPPGTTLGHAVAYNSGDLTPGHSQGSGSTYQVCKHYSMSAFSFTKNSSSILFGATFSGTRFPTPNGIAYLAGDPSIVAQDVGSAWKVFVASLAITNDRWGTTNCLSGLPQTDAVCVSTATIPKGSGSVTLGTQWCVTNGSNYDGTALQMTTNNGVNKVYLTTSDLPSGGGIPFCGRTHVWEVGNANELPMPFPDACIKGHTVMPRSQPALNLESGIVTVMAPDSDRTFWIGRIDPSQSPLTWGTSTLPTSGCTCNNNQAVNIAGSTLLREIGYTIDSYSAYDALDHMYVFYPVFNSAGFVQEQGAWCSFSFGTVGGCAIVPGLITPPTANAYLPTVAVNHFTTTAWLSYWTDATTPTGNLQMSVDKILLNQNLVPTGLHDYPLTGVNEAPCPGTADNGGTWGDYDALTIANAKGVPSLLRYLTDSTASTCSGGFPQHVSVALGDGAL